MAKHRTFGVFAVLVVGVVAAGILYLLNMDVAPVVTQVEQPLDSQKLLEQRID